MGVGADREDDDLKNVNVAEVYNFVVELLAAIVPVEGRITRHVVSR